MDAQGQAVLTAIRRRRVAREFTDQPVSREDLVQVLEAARWAPSGGNRRLHKFIAIQDPVTIRLIRAVSPGMLGRPTALVVVCIDWERTARIGPKPARRPTVYVDVGTAAENMLLAAHALGLGAGPVTSFSTQAVSLLLGLPDWLTPEMMVCLGHLPARRSPQARRSATGARLDDLVMWERFTGSRSPA